MPAELDLVTGRQATTMLAETGLARRHALRALSAGLAGTPMRTAGALLYDRAAVQALVDRPRLKRLDLEAICPQGLFVSRRLVDVRGTLSAQHAQLAGHWRLNPFCSVGLALDAKRGRPTPFVAAVAGFVVLGAEIVDTAWDYVGTRLVFGPPGDWFEDIAGHRLLLGRGGEWTFRRPMSRDRVWRPEPDPEQTSGVGRLGT